jgi:hypothetical protein
MAKKAKKKSKKKDSSGTDAVGAVRTAVERTFQATADSAQSTRTRAQDLVDEVAGAAGRLREMIEHVGVLEDLKKQVDALAKRVAALEGDGSSSKPAARTRKPAARKSTAGSSTASRSTASRSTASRSTARKPAASRAKSGSSSSRAKSGSSSSRSAASRSTASRSKKTS